MVESEPPTKLFAHKPKRAQIKKSQGNVAKDFSPQRASVPPPPVSSTPPSAPVKESFARRYKYLWPTLLAVNLAYGGFS
uniref:Uncharacterized protein n=1 Tax=Kalanchoe fedtschenkoi TaxID=63787 RepID=A0A7N0UXT9_KALFE